MLRSAEFLALWLTLGGKSSFSRLLCTGGGSRGWELSQQRITGTWFPCSGSPVRLRGRKQQQGRGSQPKAELRAADVEHILQWRKKRGEGSVQVIHHVLPTAPSRALFSSKSAWVKKTSCNTHHMCLCMSWAAEDCPKSWNLAKRGKFSSGGWAGFHCPQWSVIPFLTNALKSLCLRDQRIDNFAMKVSRGHSPTVVWSKPEAPQLTRLLPWPWKQCGLAVFILGHLCEFKSDLGVMIRQT